MHGSFPDPETIVCKDCAYRDKLVVELCGKRIAAGYGKGACEKYSLKPHAVLFNNAPCQYYQQDPTAPPHVVYLDKEEERKRRHQEEDENHEFTPIHAQWADATKMACWDCVFRDRTVVELLGKRFEAGIARSNCEIYHDKPSDVYYDNAPCQYYRKDPEATGQYITVIDKKAAD